MGGIDYGLGSGKEISIFEEKTEGTGYCPVIIRDEQLDNPELRLAVLRSIQRIIGVALADRCPYHFLSLSMRTQSVLQRHAMNTFRDITSKSRVDLLALRGFSKIMVRELEEELSHWSLSLAESIACKHARKKLL